MIECPKCGYVDEPYWRPTFNRKNQEDYTTFYNFTIMFPKEVESLKNDNHLHIAPYTYRLTKWGNVIRTWDCLKNGSRDYEKHVRYNINHHVKTLEAFR